MNMQIPLAYNDVYSDSMKRFHLTTSVEATKVITEETSRGQITRDVEVKMHYLEIERGRTHILLTSNNAPLIDKLAHSDLFDYVDAGHAKLVTAMLPGDVQEAEIVSEVKEVEVAPEPEIKVTVDEETGIDKEGLMNLKRADLMKLAKEQGVKFEMSDKKDDLIEKIIAG